MSLQKMQSMGKTIIFPVVVLVFLSSCFSKKKSTPEIVAAELCKCYAVLESELELVGPVILKAATYDNPEMVLFETVQQLNNTGDSVKIKSDLEKLMQAENGSSAAGRCLKVLYEKYNGVIDFKKKQELVPVINELKKQNCHFSAVVVGWNLQN